MAFPPSSQTTTSVAVPATECAKLGQKLLDRGANLQGGARSYLRWVVVVLGVGLGGVMFAAYLPKFDLEAQQTSATQELINTKREEIDAINMMLPVLRNVNLRSVELAADGRVGITVGQRGLVQPVVLTTADFGATWTEQIRDISTLTDIALTETGKGIAVGSDIVLTTADFGATWTEQDGHEGASLQSVALADETGRGIAVGRDIVLTTADFGATWTKQVLDRDRKFWLQSVALTETGKGIAVGQQGRTQPIVLTTANFGAIWTEQVLDRDREFWLQSVALTETGRGIAVGRGIVLTTTDFGATWTEQDGHEGASLQSVALTETGRGIAVGRGIVLTTTDFGATWTEQDGHEGASLQSVALADETGRGIAVGRSIVLTTADFGATWTTVEEKTLGQKETLFQEIRALETGPGEPLTATEELISRVSIRLAILVLVLFLVQVLVGLNRYNTRLAAFYLARGDTLLLLSAGDDPIRLPLDVAERLTQMLSPDQLDFGRSPKAVAQQAMDLAQNLLASRNLQNR